jgi:hypothetical protein
MTASRRASRAQRVDWLTGKIESYPPRKVIPSAAVLHAQRLSAAHETVSKQLEKEARIAERAKELVATIAWPDQSRLEKTINEFLDRHRKDSWLRPMTIAGIRHAKRALAARDKDAAS